MDDKEARLAQSDNARSAAASHIPEGATGIASVMGILLVPVLVLACAVMIAYLSVLTSKTLNLSREISQIQYESEQLRLHVITSFPEPRQVDTADAFRRRLHELKDAGAWGPYDQQINAVMLQGGQFAEQVEQAWFTNTMLERVAEQLTKRVRQNSGTPQINNIYQQLSVFLHSVLHPSASYSEQEMLSLLNEILSGLKLQSASLDEAEKQQVRDIMLSLEPALLRFVQYRSVAEAVQGGLFPEQLRQLKLSLFQYEQHLNRLTMLFCAVLAMTSLGCAGYGLIRRHKKHAQLPMAMNVIQPSEVTGSANTVSGLATGGEAKRERFVVPSEPVLDIPYMLDNMDGDREAVAMLLGVFLEEHCNDARRLSACIEEGQNREAGLIAHSLKSVAGSFGAEPLRGIAEQIEHRCKQGLAIEAEHIRRFGGEIEALKTAITDYLQPVQPASVSDTSQPEIYKSKQESLAVLNAASVLSTMDDDTESVKLLLQVFIDEHALDAKKLQQLAHQCTPDAIGETAFRLVHSLKGVAGSIGAEALRRQAEHIELCYKRQQVVADEEYRKLSQVLDKTVVAARNFLAEQPAGVG